MDGEESICCVTGKPSKYVLRFQNHLESSNISFVAGNHTLSAQLRLSFDIDGISGSVLNPSIDPAVHRTRHPVGCKFATKNKNRELEMFYASKTTYNRLGA